METNLTNQIEIVSIIVGLLGIITLIVFFIMSANIAIIKNSMQSIETFLEVWANMNGYNEKRTCKNCKKIFYGHPEKCPHCGDPKTYV